MIHITRRTLIASTALVPLAACQPGTTVQTVTAAMITDLGLIIGGITSKLPTLSSLGAGVANLVTDAHLAALASEHGCELISTDTDFSRFPGVRWKNPLK